VGASGFSVGAIGINKETDEIGAMVKCFTVGFKFILGGSTGFTNLSGAVPVGVYSAAGSLSCGDGTWVFGMDIAGLGQSWMAVVGSDGTPIFYAGVGGQPSGGNTHVRLGSSASVIFYHGNPGIGGATLSRTDDNFATAWTDLTNSPPANTFDSDVTGQYLMGADRATGLVYQSSDGGVTWTQINNLPTDFYLANNVRCIDANKWIVIGEYNILQDLTTQNNVIFTPDFGITWETRMGNLTSFLATGTADGFDFDLIT